jgi:long-chain acyl-CoA synthetase
MSGYTDRPWLASYPAGVSGEFTLEHPSLLAAFAATAAARPQTPAICYFDAVLTYRQLDEQSDALACALLDGGLQPGERVALYLQNVPAYPLAMLATWKAGGIAVAVNPMNKVRELTGLFADSAASVLVTLEDLHTGQAAAVVPDSSVTRVITTSGLEYQTRNDERVLGGITRHRPSDTEDLAELLAAFAGKSPPPLSPTPADVAFLTYTSGTTGAPKGATNTHGNISAGGQWYRDWNGLGPEDSVLAIAPMFHVTGLSGHMAAAFVTGIPMILTYRYEPGVVIDAIRERRPTFTVAAITAYVALANAPGTRADDLVSFTKLLTGGAPVAPAIVDTLQQQFGAYIHNVYGMTETTSPTHATPMGVPGPVDPRSGALSVGLPVPGLSMAVIGEDDTELPPGEIGELIVSGPTVVPGYWNKPVETANSFRDGMLRTGDVGFMDEAGWFYIVDRKKDMISAAGYKVWPRDVEDVLYQHPAVRQAAVVGVPDDYRGETVLAYVSLKSDTAATSAELVAHCRDRLAVYKVPRTVEILDELPATVTGKLLRRELRDRAARANPP